MRGLVSRTRLAYWLVPVFFLAASVVLQACGDDDGGGLCEDQENLGSLEECEAFGRTAIAPSSTSTTPRMSAR